MTALHDPILALFGAKQYFFYPVVAAAMTIGYGTREGESALRNDAKIVACFLIPITALSLIEILLPADYWINTGIGGNPLDMFSAGGRLRISGTFASGGQFCYFLNAFAFIGCIWIFGSTRSRRGKLGNFLQITVIACYGISTFATGDRTAVWGDAAVLAIGSAIALFKGTSLATIKLPVYIAIGIVITIVARDIVPYAFDAYNARSSGEATYSHRQEMTDRIVDMLVGWTKGTPEAPPTFLGYGVGVMSNGSYMVSGYANEWRAGGFWTENELATVLFEGGWYLIVIWEGFKIAVITASIFLVNRIRRPEWLIVSSVACGFVVVYAVIAQISNQPPAAIWLWLACGTVMAVARIEGMKMAGLKSLQRPSGRAPIRNQWVREANGF
ncbi:MAG TPA: hypothetical protein VG722_09870 [Tepidisphaeraceae bacterium]|nr:hypothetical protein [Tepidisphaeraceae bacterium]